ncbi:MAG: hypothetical protein Q4B50_08880, partial [Bacillota bacterium]|nr:hypothetical protein [Bacillota bacterium]
AIRFIRLCMGNHQQISGTSAILPHAALTTAQNHLSIIILINLNNQPNNPLILFFLDFCFFTGNGGRYPLTVLK